MKYEALPKNKLHNAIIAEFGTLSFFAKKLKISRAIIYRWIKAGKIPHDARVKDGIGVSRAKIIAGGYNPDTLKRL